MAESQLSNDAVLERLDRIAERAVLRFKLPDDAVSSRINVSENATYRVESGSSGQRWALRVHREGYHSRTEIASELVWLQALKKSNTAHVPEPIAGNDGEFIQTIEVDGLPGSRNVVLFAWEAGSEPAGNDVGGFELLGETAARMHQHVRAWARPHWFARHTWDFDTTLGDHPHWGRWRDGLGMTPEIEGVLGETVALIRKRLERFGKSPDVFNLIHGDMRLANLLMDQRQVKVIDFDDCGLSWFLYDCATTVSFFEEAPEVSELIKAWVRGYRRIGKLDAAEEAEIATFVMLRRILLIAWIGSHSETELARSMGVAYTGGTLPLCERYLSQFGSAKSSVTAQKPIADAKWWRRIFTKRVLIN